MRVSGGGARSRLWRTILADVFDCPVRTVNVVEGAAFGAAVLAAVGAGLHASVSSATEAIVRDTSTTEPGPDAPCYRALYEAYRALYPALAETFHALSTLDAPR